MTEAPPDPTVLVVDDLPQNVRLLDAVLSPRGYRVLSATSGETALRVLSTERPDLVLLDILMPDMDGYDVCRRIRENPGTAYLPVVMITASGAKEKLRAVEAGADDFVTKPFVQGELLARISSLIRIKRYHDTIERQAAELAEWNRELEHRVAAHWTSCAGSGGFADSCLRNSPTWWSAPATNRSSTATAVRSSWCSAIYGASPRSPNPANRKK
ncbi:MAG TPA: response regulator [Nakamurella sp.]